MLVAFVLFLREGLEATLIVSILLAALRHMGMTKQRYAVWTGVALAVIGCIVGAVVLYFAADLISPDFLVIFKTATYLVAVVLLTGMTIWMQQHSRTLKQELFAQAASAGSGVALGLLAFTTVGREGLETAIFALAFALNTNVPLFLIGGLLGIAAAVVLGILIYGMGYRLNFRVFFRVMGVALLIFAAGLLSNAIQELQAQGYLPFGADPLWDTSTTLSEESFLGSALHTFVGYAEMPTGLQVGVYIAYLAIFGGFFGWLTRKPAAPATLPPASDTVTQTNT
jgi:high-affinity iron transporter